MSKITFGDKTPVEPQVSHSTQWWADDANEVKNIVNENDTVDTSTSSTVLFDEVTGYIHGTWTTPITGDITLDETGAVEGGCAVVVFSGLENPNFITTLTKSSSGIITVQGLYSIYIHYIAGRYNINIFNVENPGNLELLFQDNFTGATIDIAKWVVTEPDAEVVISQNNELKIAVDGTTDPAARTTSLRSINSFSIGSSTVVLTFDLLSTTADLAITQNFAIGLNKSTDPTNNDDTIGLLNKNTDNIGLLIKEVTSVIQNVTASTPGYELTPLTFKIVTTAANVEYYYWSGSTWTQLGSTYAHSGTGSYYIHIGANDKSSLTEASDLIIDSLALTNLDFSTQRP